MGRKTVCMRKMQRYSSNPGLQPSICKQSSISLFIWSSQPAAIKGVHQERVELGMGATSLNWTVSAGNNLQQL